MIVSGQDSPSDMSETKATVGVPQLSASSLTSLISTGGIRSKHVTSVSGIFEAVGGIVSWTIIFWVTLIELPQESVTE